MGIIQEDSHWWFGSSADGTRSGLFPAAYVALLESPAEPEPESEAEEEAPPPPTAPAAEDRDQNDDVGLLPMSLSGGSGGVDVAIL